MLEMCVLCVGAAVMDITASPIPEQKDWKQKQRIKNITIRTGGDAANQAAHLADVGLHPMLCACVGGDANGEMLKAAMSARGVDVSFIRTKADMSTGTALVLVGAEGERTIFSARGAHSVISREDLPEQIPDGVRAISLASLFSMPLLEENGLKAFLAQARDKRIPVFADLLTDVQKKGLPWIEPFLPLIDYFLPSLYEAEELTGKQGEEACAAFLRGKGCGNVIIKCGARGCYVDSPSFTGHVAALKVEPVDTTGAGDCMVAFFIARTLLGDDMETACRRACEAASRSTLQPGAACRILLN